MMRLLFLVMVWLVVGGSWARAMDSTQSIPPKVGWNKPSAKRADSAAAADYATKSGEANSAVTANSATTATTVDAQALTGIPDCAIGQVLTKSAAGWVCTDTVAKASNAETSTMCPVQSEQGNTLPAARSGTTYSWEDLGQCRGYRYLCVDGTWVGLYGGSSSNSCN